MTYFKAGEKKTICNFHCKHAHVTLKTYFGENLSKIKPFDGIFKAFL
jgi:hypothetical protein